MGSVVILVFCMWLAATSASGGPPATLAGTWEGFISETPARLILTQVRLAPKEGGWEGTISLPGSEGLPLSAIRSDDTGVHFELHVGDDSVLFDVTLDGREMSGRVQEGDSVMGLDLRKLPVYPVPGNRVEAWRQDLDVVRTRFLRYDRSFDEPSRAALEKALDKLEGALAHLNDQEVMVALSEAIALSGNAHTRLYLLRNRTELRRLPVRLYWFTDGLFVIAAKRELSGTLGCKVSRLAGHAPEDVKERVAHLFAGNASWVDYKSPFFMASAEILYGLGLIGDMEQVAVTFDCPGEKPVEKRLAPLPLERSGDATEPWWDLSPRWHSDGDGWVSALAGVEPVPLSLRHPHRHYWLERLPESRALYVQYNRSQNMPEGETFEDFAAEVESLLDREQIRRLILDLRFNTGGDNSIAAPFMERLATLDREGKLGTLVVITGRATFSAGISHAAYLKQNTHAVFVGEPVGDELDTWSEGGNLILPNSKLTVHFTNGFHSLSAARHPELAPYLWSDLDVESLAPDMPVSLSSGEFLAGKDPSLEAALRQPVAPPRQE